LVFLARGSRKKRSNEVKEKKKKTKERKARGYQIPRQDVMDRHHVLSGGNSGAEHAKKREWALKMVQKFKKGGTSWQRGS